MDIVVSCFWTQNFDFIRKSARAPNPFGSFSRHPSLARFSVARIQLDPDPNPHLRYILRMPTDPARQLLRHTVAALAYRAARALDGAPDHFAGYAAAGRMPVQILAHMGDLFAWALSISVGNEQWGTAQPRPWADEEARFFSALKAFDDFLASEAPLAAPIDRLMQGPVADALTHVGQLAMLRRLSGSPAIGENFFIADVTVGCVGADQPPAVQPFK
jgi:hypothetical protein